GRTWAPPAPTLPEVVRRHVVAESRKRPDADRPYGEDAVLPLRDPVDHQVGLGHQRQAMAREDRRGYDHVRDSRLVLEGEEDEALRGARALADDDAPCHLDPGAVFHAAELARAQDAAAPERRAAQGHRVAAERHAGAGVIGGESLDVRHLAQRALLGWWIREQRPGVRLRGR